MTLADEQYHRLVRRAWTAVMDAQECAENQGRDFGARKLARSAAAIGEVENDLSRTAAVQIPGQLTMVEEPSEPRSADLGRYGAG